MSTTPSKNVIAWVLLAGVAMLASCDSSTNEPFPGQPNLIVVLTDDLDWASVAHLPRLQRLADEGVTFESFFLPTTICAPSRATFLRGQYAHNHGTIGNGEQGYSRFWQLGRERSTIATWLQSAGYRTVYIGKYVNPYNDAPSLTHVPDGWSEWYASLGQYFGFKLNENGVIVEYPCCDDYATDVLSAKAADFIRRSAGNDEPFLMFIAPYAPHSPYTPAPRHAGEFPGTQAPRPPSFNEADVSDKPAAIASRNSLTQEKIDELDEIFRNRLRTMLAVEDMLDTLSSVLESEDLVDRTYLFVTSDNGYHYGEHRLRRGKTTAYDEDVRAPLFVSGPGLPGGRTIDEMVLSTDIAPTLADFAGATASSSVDGRSFVRLLFSGALPAESQRRGFTVERWQPAPDSMADEPYWLLGYRAVRTEDYLYVEWDTGEFELYDRRTDPYELESIYERADPTFLAEVAAWLDRLSGCAGVGCEAAEDEAPPLLRFEP